MRLEDEEGEPVAVVRTLADFALALTLIVLMLVGTRAPAAGSADTQRPATRAASAQAGAQRVRLTVALTESGQFLTVAPTVASAPVDAATLARQWASFPETAPASLVVQFQPKTLATDLHRALLELQSAFDTNLVTILTCPALPK